MWRKRAIPRTAKDALRTQEIQKNKLLNIKTNANKLMFFKIYNMQNTGVKYLKNKNKLT